MDNQVCPSQSHTVKHSPRRVRMCFRLSLTLSMTMSPFSVLFRVLHWLTGHVETSLAELLGERDASPHYVEARIALDALLLLYHDMNRHDLGTLKYQILPKRQASTRQYSIQTHHIRQ